MQSLIYMNTTPDQEEGKGEIEGPRKVPIDRTGISQKMQSECSVQERRRLVRFRCPSEPRMRRIVLERQQVMAHRHIPIETWLEALGMKEYSGLFSQYNGVEDLLQFTEVDINDLGLKNAALRAKVISSLRILKDKYERGHKIVPGLQRSFSATAQLSPPPPGSYPDYQVVNVSPERLQRDLHSELQSDASELKHWPWYHGDISRQRAEKLVLEDGDFVVRDCISEPGDFVLTCCWHGVPLHFMINSHITESPSSHVPEISYHFEDVNFSSIQDLVQFYMSHKKPITKTSGAVVSNPVARVMPLSYYDSKYGTQGSLVGGMDFTYTPSQSPHASPYNSPRISPKGSPRSQRKHPQRAGSQPLLSLDDDLGQTTAPHIDRCDSLPSIPNKVYNMNGMKNSISASSLPNSGYHIWSGSAPAITTDNYSGNNRVNTNRSFHGRVEQNNHNNNSSTQFLTIPRANKKITTAISDSDLTKPPPPKPSRIPSIKYKVKPNVQKRNMELYEDDGRDYSDYSMVKEDPSWLDSDRTLTRNNANQNSLYPPESMDDYDNNFNRKKSEGGYQNSSDIPNGHVTSLSHMPSQRSRLASDTRFSILDHRNSSEFTNTQTNNHSLNTNSGNSDSFSEPVTLRPKTNKRKLITMPSLDNESSLNIAKFTTTLLPEENKPLDASALLSVKTLMLQKDAKILATHLTKVDLEILKVADEYDLGLGIQSGLELMTLPQGKQLRQDVIERSYCTKVFTMVTILTGQKVTERAQILSQWIQIAMQLKSTLGNLYGFSAVMEGLTSLPIQRLRDTWMVLRQNHTSSAFIYDTKHKAAFKALTDGSGLLPLQNVCIPDIASLVNLLERDSDSLKDYLPWEITDPNYGLDIMLTHLDTARLITAQSGLYRVTSQALMKDVTFDTELLDMFRTEFHLKLHWGSKGAVVDRTQRKNKFEQLLTVLSNRAEPPGDDGTEV